MLLIQLVKLKAMLRSVGELQNWVPGYQIQVFANGLFNLMTYGNIIIFQHFCYRYIKKKKYTI